MGDFSQAMPGQRTCLLVLGMHRSGTSAITRILSLMGAELPKQLLGALPGNESGHWEPERLVLLHDQMLAEAGSSWRDLRPFDPAQLGADRLDHYKTMIQSIIQDEFGNAYVFVLKDPRICRFIPIYRSVLSNLDVHIHPIIMIRSPLEVSASLSARDKMSNAYGLLLWLRHCLDVEKYTRDMARVLVGYDRVVSDISNVIVRLAKSLSYLPLLYNSSEINNLILSFIRPDLRHQTISSDDVDQCSLTRTWINEAHSAFQTFLTGKGEGSAIACLDRISHEFNNASPLLAQLADDVDGLRIQQRQLEDNTSLLQNELKQLRDHIQRNAEQHAQGIQRNADQYAQEIQWNSEQHAHDLQRHAEQHARELQRSSDQHAWEIQQKTNQYTRELAGLQRIDYDRRLPPELTGLRQWLSNRSKRRRRFVQEYHKIAASPLFDRDWYLQKNPDVAAAGVNAALHYLQSGGREGRAPGPYFEANAYLKANPDVAATGANPLLHFLGTYKDGGFTSAILKV